MYPHLVSIGSFEVTTFGLMMMIAALVGLWIFRTEAHRAGLPEQVFDAAIAGIFGGLLGAKIFWAIEHRASAPMAELLFSRGGLSWYGGLIGGVGSGVLYCRLKGWPLVAVIAAATPALAFGHVLGRIGCFLVGDDYGWPTDLPWGVAFPEGLPPTTVPVHPTQIYEALGLVVIGALLIRWRRAGLQDQLVIGRYLVLAGALRLAIEFVRVHEPLALGLAPAHWISLAAVGAGAATLVMSPAARTATTKRRTTP